MTFREKWMTRYAVLIGAADLSQGMQKSLVEFKDFLTGGAGGLWREDEILITGPLGWQFVQLLQTRLRKYDFVLVYRCRLPHSVLSEDYSEKLKELTDGNGVFITDECAEFVRAEEDDESAPARSDG